MTTPTPLTQQRQFVRDFLAASQQRSQRETAAQQQYAAGEKAAQEQHAGSLRAAQQSYTATIKTQDDTLRAQKSQINQAVDTIDAARRDAREYLRILDTPLSELPPALEDSTPQSPTVRDGKPVAALTAGAGRIRQLGINAGQLLEAKNRQRARQQKQVIGATVAVLILAVVGYFFYQRWNVEQSVAANRAALSSALAAASREGRSAVVNPVDGATYVPVPAGEFIMGSPESVGDDDEHPQHTVYLDAFWIMQTEVTNAQYARCVAAGACSAPDNSYWQDPAYGQHPVTDVDWNQAAAYAQWVGGRLPTEAEWEKAARGTDGRTYPWGDEQPDSSLANCCGFVNDTTPVGSYPAGASPYGALDMAGNVWEWTADWYDSGYYSQSPAQNPTGPAGGDYRVLRGGSFYVDSAFVRVAGRRRYNLDLRSWNLGFRVASSSPGF
ncbi:MAG: hypothetical protein BroJett021_06540 [Chloroflexota bacterium]|nr:MAG: hypothetical protein BroJett021_06540 [Chloroflexota bacterium]